MDDEKKYWVAFSVFPGIGPMRFGLMLEYFETAKKSWHASGAELRQIHLGAALVDKFLEFRHLFHIDAYIQQILAQRVGIVTKNDPSYPKHLSHISDAPFVLYVKGIRGDAPIDLNRAVAVVGTRRITPYGRDVTEKIVSGLVGSGITIVSGMAYGVDAVAHSVALESGGATIAVLGCGIDIIAPASNAGLYHQIVTSGHGAVVSEMPLGHKPSKGLFPARNRIISGMCLGVVVTEGTDDSGSLITARNAAEQGRDVFAVPGSITSPYSRGPAKLIKNGAQLVESADDIIDALGIKKQNSPGKNRYAGKSDSELLVLHFLTDGPVHIDALARSTGLTISALASTLTVLELEQVVKDMGDKVYTLI